MSVPPAVEMRGVTATRGRIEVLHGIDLTVDAGEIVGLVGPNGAGKSTTLAVVGGLITPTGGLLRLGGQPLAGVSAASLARVGVAVVPQGRGVFAGLTVEEHLRLATHTGVGAEEIFESAFGQFPRLAQRRRSLAGSLSGGEQQMLSLARALAGRPDLLAIDELSAGLAPVIVEELYETVAALAADGTSILLVEQYASVVERFAHRAVLMARGRVVATGGPEVIEGRLSAAYFGGMEPVAGSEAPSGPERLGANVAALAEASERRWRAAGVGLLVLAAAAILAGWWGASGTAEVYEQLPYVISGGLFGVAAAAVGGALVVRASVVEHLRIRSQELRHQSERMVEVLERVEDRLAREESRDG